MSEMANNLQNRTRHTRRLAIVGFPDVLLLDIAGPAQVFGSANKILGWTAYDLQVVTEHGDDVVTDTGLRMGCDASFLTLHRPHDLIVPGGPAVDMLLDDESLRNFLIAMMPKVERVISVCSGSLLTASAGLLDGRLATTHWERTRQAHKRFPKVQWRLDRIYTQDGKFYCSAGVTTGIDLCISLVEDDHGRDVALRVAREMVVFMQRQGGQSQYSAPLMAQSTTSKRLNALYSMIEADPTRSWSVPEMAKIGGTTERTLHRDFMREFGHSPSRFVEERRVSLARLYLESSAKPIKEIAGLSGFGTEQKMRRSFVKVLGILPSHYRDRFGEETEIPIQA